MYMDVPDMKCTSCDESETELYSCETCDQSDECSNEAAKELMCESCISPHVRKGHDVRTSKGHVPLVCPDHKKLHNLYCKTCDVTFCPKCLEVHSTHEMGSIDKRAVEIKKEVFEMLTRLEHDEKPLHAKNKSVCELQMNHQNEQEQLKQFVDKQIEELRRKAFARIDENLQLLENEKEKVVEVIDRVLKLQQESRNLLSATSPHLIKDFEQVKESYRRSVTACEKALVVEYHVRNAAFDQVENVVREFEKKFEEILKADFSTICLKSIEYFAVNSSSDKTYLFTLRDGTIKVENISWNNSDAKLNHQFVGRLDYDDYVKSYYHLLDDQNGCTFIVIGQSAHRIHVKTSNWCKISEIDLPSFQKIICPYVVNEDTNQIHWCYWIEDRKILKFSHHSSFEVDSLSSMPTFKTKRICGHELCFVTQCSKKILVADPVECSSEVLHISSDELGSMESITFFYRDYYFIWSEQSKAIVCMHKKKCFLNRRELRKWENPFSIVSLDCAPGWGCLPALPSSSNSDKLNYVFAFIRM